jgi:hypothetical protein
MLRPVAGLLFTISIVATGCGGPGLVTGEGGEPAPAQTDCGADHELVGAVAVLDGRNHDVAGTFTLVDDCTLVLEDFQFDGGGLDVRVVGSADGDFSTGHVLTTDLRRSEGYDGETLEIALPEGTTPDDVRELSVWCVPAGADFGSGVLAHAAD